MQPDRIKLLLVDDNHSLLESTAPLLEFYGYDFRIAADGETALAKLEDSLPDIILMDTFMPDRQGYDVCKDIRDLYGDEVIIVGTSSDDYKQIREAWERSGANKFLPKNTPFSEVDKAIRDLVSARSR